MLVKLLKKDLNNFFETGEKNFKELREKNGKKIGHFTLIGSYIEKDDQVFKFAFGGFDDDPDCVVQLSTKILDKSKPYGSHEFLFDEEYVDLSSFDKYCEFYYNGKKIKNWNIKFPEIKISHGGSILLSLIGCVLIVIALSLMFATSLKEDVIIENIIKEEVIKKSQKLIKEHSEENYHNYLDSLYKISPIYDSIQHQNFIKDSIKFENGLIELGLDDDAIKKIRNLNLFDVHKDYFNKNTGEYVKTSWKEIYGIRTTINGEWVYLIFKSATKDRIYLKHFQIHLDAEIFAKFLIQSRKTFKKYE